VRHHGEIVPSRLPRRTPSALVRRHGPRVHRRLQKLWDSSSSHSTWRGFRSGSMNQLLTAEELLRGKLPVACLRKKPRLQATFWEGTSSTRAVTAAESIAASSRWGNAAPDKHFPQPASARRKACRHEIISSKLMFRWFRLMIVRRAFLSLLLICLGLLGPVPPSAEFGPPRLPLRRISCTPSERQVRAVLFPSRPA